jgi:hypothetical protein
MDRPSTGIDTLDEVLGGLGAGNNVVWQAADPAEIGPFCGSRALHPPRRLDRQPSAYD